MEQNNHQQPKVLQETSFKTGKQELIFAALSVLFGLLLCNSVYAGDYNLGFAICAIGLILSGAGYLWSQGRRPDGYSGALLGCSVLLAASFGWSCDGFVKFIMFCFLVLSAGLGLCLMAGQNRRDPARAGSFWDGFDMLFRLGFGKMPDAIRGLGAVFLSNSTGKKTGAVLLGLALALPVLGLVLPLLIGADAAFEALMDRMPELEVEEAVFTVIFGLGLAMVTYSQAVAAKYAGAPKPVVKKKTGLSPLTVNTVLGCLCFVYLVYLFSQLAYFVGGFAGLLPEEYSLAEYARRGFFEMATLCAVNLAVILGSLGFMKREGATPLSTRVLCLAIGFVTLFFVCAASAKMFMYIGSYGMTRLRLLTQIIMLFLVMTTGVVSVWLFVPKLPYMKVVILGAMLIGLTTVWMDVDSVVARYNVDAYLTGKLETVDVDYLRGLSDGALLQLERLAEEAPDENVANRAKNALRCRWNIEDLRGWNYFNAAAEKWKK